MKLQLTFGSCIDVLYGYQFFTFLWKKQSKPKFWRACWYNVFCVKSYLTSPIGMSLFTGRRWIKQMFIGAFLIPAMVCGTAFFINFIAIYYHASRAIPFGTMVSHFTGEFKHHYRHRKTTFQSKYNCESQLQLPSQTYILEGFKVLQV